MSVTVVVSGIGLANLGPWNKTLLSETWLNWNGSSSPFRISAPLRRSLVPVLVILLDDLTGRGTVVMTSPDQSVIISTVIKSMKIDSSQYDFKLISTLPNEMKKRKQQQQQQQPAERYMSPTRKDVGLDVSSGSQWLDPAETPQPQYIILMSHKKHTSETAVEIEGLQLSSFSSSVDDDESMRGIKMHNVKGDLVNLLVSMITSGKLSLDPGCYGIPPGYGEEVITTLSSDPKNFVMYTHYIQGSLNKSIPGAKKVTETVEVFFE